jgi:hypothetical protein
MSLMYYSRMRAITKLLPLLLQSNLPATVVSVYAAGMEKVIYLDDLSLRDLSHYSYSQARSHMVYMHTLYMETLAEQHPGKLALIHIYPGLVKGPGFDNPEYSLLLRMFMKWIIFPVLGPFIGVPPDECGERMLSLASAKYPPRGAKSEEGACVGTDGKHGSGVYALGAKGDDAINMTAYGRFDKDAIREKVWDHTNKAFEVIQLGNVFTE